MIICPTCGNEVPQDAIICPVCGTILKDTTGLLGEARLLIDHLEPQPPNPPYTDHVGRLRAGEVALYIENVATPIIVDVSKGVTIGRSSNNKGEIAPTVAVNAFDAFTKGVSRIHVTLAANEGQVVIIDEYATNGTWLNGVRLEPMTPTLVNNGDEIILSKLRLRIFLPRPAAPTMPSGSSVSP